MKVKRLWFLAVLYFMVLINGSLQGQVPDSWTMEVKIAANVTEDADICEVAESSNEREVFRDGQLVGKWVEVLESKEADLEKEPNLLTRRNKQGKLELLVFISANDVTEADVRFVSADKDVSGRLALKIILDKKGSTKIFNLTKTFCAYGEPKHFAALIMDKKVYSAPKIVSPVSGAVMITGDITMELIEDIRQRSKLVRVYDESELPPYAITITPLRLIVFVCVLLFIIVGSLPAKNLQKSKYPHFWTISGSIVGMLVGAYIFGVTKTTGIESTIVETWQAVMGETIVINLPKLFIGSIIGIGCGFLFGRLCRFFVRRAVHNIAGTIIKLK